MLLRQGRVATWEHLLSRNTSLCLVFANRLIYSLFIPPASKPGGDAQLKPFVTIEDSDKGVGLTQNVRKMSVSKTQEKGASLGRQTTGPREESERATPEQPTSCARWGSLLPR